MSIILEMRDWSHSQTLGGGRRWWRQEELYKSTG